MPLEFELLEPEQIGREKIQSPGRSADAIPTPQPTPEPTPEPTLPLTPQPMRRSLQLRRSLQTAAVRPLRILVVDGYAKKSRVEFEANSMPLASTLYQQTLLANAPVDQAVDFTTIFPCEESYIPPTDDELGAFDGCAFTGSSYSAYDDNVDVTRQIELMARTFDCGVSSFGSCWGLQIAAVALGGKVELNPKGREVGVGRKIMLSDEGRDHDMFRGKKTTFEAFESHSDEVTALPSGAEILAGNDHTAVQAMAVSRNGTSSWFVQYHPEYNFDYFASLISIRTERMVSMGFFEEATDVANYVSDLKILHANPERKDLLWKYGIDEDLTDPLIKQCEVRNWVQHLLRQS